MRRLCRQTATAAIATSAARNATTFQAAKGSPDADGKAEFSVVYTDRAVNHMSVKFQGVMNSLNDKLKTVYKSDATIILPGSGSSGMEAVARQFATNKKCLVLRNGFFSFRWTQIFEQGNIPSSHIVLKGQRVGEGAQAPFVPHDINKVVETILAEKPEVVFAPHVETSSGIIITDEYIQAVTKAVHSYGGLFVLDGIASGCAWVDMEKLDADIYITAPQKGWSAPAAAGVVMMRQRALDAMEKGTPSSSFVLDLKKWHTVMQTYVGGAHMYHCTMPTDALIAFNHAVTESMEKDTLAKLEEQQWELGNKVRAALLERGFPSVAGAGAEAPGVVVSYTTDSDVQSGKKFAGMNMQIAGGVPLQIDEGADFKTFRLGLFGLDKLRDVDGSVAQIKSALDAIKQ